MKNSLYSSFCEALENGMGYTFLKENGENFSKEELIEISAELIFAIEDSDTILELDKSDIFNSFVENTNS